MSFAKKVGAVDIYQGKSFTRSIGKKTKDGTAVAWEAEDIGDFDLYNSAGVSIVLTTNTLIKSADNMSLTFVLGSTDTESLLGEYLLIANLKNSVDAEIDVTLAEYAITFEEKKAGE